MRIVRTVSIALLSVALATEAMAQLRSRIGADAAAAHGRVGVACSLPGVALDCGLNQGEGLPMQSVYKFPIAMAALHAVAGGRLKLNQQIAFLPSDAVRPGIGSPLRNAHPKGGVDVPLEELLRLAIEESDGTASDILLRVLGGPAVVDAYVRGLGIAGIHIRDTEKALGADVQAQYRNDASAAALVALLRLLADRSPLNAEHTALLLRMMTEAKTGPHRIRGMLPPGTQVAHKTGTSGTHKGVTNATNDVGLITMPDGRRLAVVVLVTDSPESEAAREAVIARIAKDIWDAAGGKK